LVLLDKTALLLLNVVVVVAIVNGEGDVWETMDARRFSTVMPIVIVTRRDDTFYVIKSSILAQLQKKSDPKNALKWL
jgi:hypothetical protein